MCTNLRKILNPSKRLGLDAGQPLYLYVPCGHCYECRKKLQNEWYIRTYYHFLDTIKSGGYVLFDTLTYNNEHLPHVNDFIDVPKRLNFSCFRSQDITLFMKRLRSYLHHLGYPVETNLDYFITCEYGSEKFTFRPHYHCFFFVRNNFIENYALSKAISYCWHSDNGFSPLNCNFSRSSIGRTDGLPYRSRFYVDRNTFRVLDYSSNIRCINYVSKYVAKDFIYENKTKNRINQILDYVCSVPNIEDDKNSYKLYKHYQKLINSFVVPFHRQSLNFGVGYVNEFGLEKLINDGFIKHRFGSVICNVGLFPSFKKKYLYNHVKKDGVVTFYLNDLGIRYKQTHLVDQVKAIDNIIDNYNCNNPNCPVHLNSFDLLFNQYRFQNNPVVSLLDCKKQIVSQCSITDYNSIRNYSFHDRDFIHKSVFTKKDFGSKKFGFVRLNILCEKFDPYTLDSFDYVTLDTLKKYVLYDADLEFQYDKVLDWYRKNGLKKLVTLKQRDRVKKILKNVFL